jgi:hypothetical protein
MLNDADGYRGSVERYFRRTLLFLFRMSDAGIDRLRERFQARTNLANYVTDNSSVDDIYVYQVMRAAGQIAAMLISTSADRGAWFESHWEFET